MNRHTIALAGAAAAVLISAAALATAAGDAPTTIEACRNTRHGLVRIVFSANACKSNETHVSWDVEGPAGPAGPSGPQGPPGPEGRFRRGRHARSTRSPGRRARHSTAPTGHVEVSASATDLILLTCESGAGTPPPRATRVS